MALDSAGKTRVLWRHTTMGSIVLWKLDALGQVEGTATYNPGAGWSAEALAVGSDGQARVLWNDINGHVSIWTILADGTYTSSPVYGPYSEGTGLNWKAIDLAVAPDNTLRLLWKRGDNRVCIWRLSTGYALDPSQPCYGPFTGATPKAIAVGADGNTRLMWQQDGGGMPLWILNPYGQVVSSNWYYGPFAGWTATGLAVGGDNKIRFFWDYTSTGQTSLWRIGTTGTNEESFNFGPYADIRARAISYSGLEGRLIWNRSDGGAFLWQLNAQGTQQSHLGAYNIPPSGLSASGANGSVVLQWSTDTQPREFRSGFVIYRSTSASGPFTSIGQTTANVTSYTDATATPGTPYFFRVATATGLIESASTPSVSATALASLSVNDVQMLEPSSGNASLQFTLTLSRASTQSVSVNVATSDNTAKQPGDYDATSSSTITFAPGVTSRAVIVLIKSDDLDEDDETFTLSLSGASGAILSRATATATIVDAAEDTPPSISVAPATVTETNANTTTQMPFVVSLSRASGRSVSVRYATQNGTAQAGSDFVGIATSQLLTFAAGETQKSVAITINGDNIDEDDETFALNLSQPANAALGTAQVLGTIVDNDAAPTVSITPALQVPEQGIVQSGGGIWNRAEFVVSLSNPSSRQVSVSYTTADITAQAGQDYQDAFTSGSLVFSPGETSRIISIGVNDDIYDEDNETFGVSLSAPQNASLGNAKSACTIVDDDPTPSTVRARFQVNPSFVASEASEGDSGTTMAIFRLSLSEPTQRTVTINYTTADDTATQPGDYIRTVGKVTFAPNTLQQIISIPIVGDTVVEALQESFYVDFSNPVGASMEDTRAKGLIYDNDTYTPPLPTLSIADANVTETDAAQNLALTLTLSAASTQDVSVTYATQPGTAIAPSDYSTSTGTVTIPAGQTSKTFTVSIAGDNVAESPEAFSVLLSNPSGATIADNSATISITDDDRAGFTFSRTTGLVTSESGATDTFTVRLTSQPSANVSFGLSSSDTGEGTVSPSTCTFTAANWSTPQTITLTGVDDALVDGDKPYTIVTSAASSTDASYSGLAVPDVSATNRDNEQAPPAALSLSVSPSTFAEYAGPGAATATLSRSGPTTSSLTVTLSSSNTNEATVPATVTLSANVATTTFAVDAIDDTLTDGTQSVILSASATGLSGATATVNVTDNETGPLSAPTNLVATGGYKKIVLTWDAVPGATSYQIQRATVGGVFDDIATVGTTTYTDADSALVIGTTYRYQVKAVGNGQQSPWSNEASAAPKPPFEILNVSNGDVLTGYVDLVAIVNSPSLSWTNLKLKVGQLKFGSGTESIATDGKRLVHFLLQTEHYNNGVCILQFADVSEYMVQRSVDIHNQVSGLRYDGIFDINSYDGITPQGCHITASVEPGLNWTVLVETSTGVQGGSYSGTGTTIDWTWDGHDNTGAEAPDGNYKILVVTTPAGAARSAAPLPTTRKQSQPGNLRPNASRSSVVAITKNSSSTWISTTLGFGGEWLASITDENGDIVQVLNGKGASVSEIWDGLNFQGDEMPDGKYLVRFTSRERQAPTPGQGFAPAGMDDGSGSRVIGITNKTHYTDSLVILSTDNYSDNNYADNLEGTSGTRGNIDYCLDYAEFIRNEIDLSYNNRFDLHAQPLVVSASLLSVDGTLPDGNEEPDTGQAARMAAIISNRFRSAQKLVYVAAHGSWGNIQTYPYFTIGNYSWHSGPNPLCTTDSAHNFDVSDLVYPLNYGDTGEPYSGPLDPPMLVWIDSCHSMGGATRTCEGPDGAAGCTAADATIPDAPDPSGSIDDSWASCFGIDEANGFEGALLGWSGNGYESGPSTADDWSAWRGGMWRRLFEQRKTVGEAFRLTNSLTTPVSPSGFRPMERSRRSGYASQRLRQ